MSCTIVCTMDQPSEPKPNLNFEVGKDVGKDNSIGIGVMESFFLKLLSDTAKIEGKKRESSERECTC